MATTDRAPAFQFYPKDYLSAEKQAVMSLAECGAYIRLLAFCWHEGSIPDDSALCARLVGETPTRFRRIWPAVKNCFTSDPELPGRLIHSRLERERQSQADFRESLSNSGKSGAAARWRGHKPRHSGANGKATATAMPENASAVCDLQVPLSKEQKEGTPALTVQAVADLWNESPPEEHLPKVVEPKAYIYVLRPRMKEHPDASWWKAYFARIWASDFLMGRLPTRPGHEHWRVSFDWVLKPANIRKVMNGNYENRVAPAAPEWKPPED